MWERLKAMLVKETIQVLRDKRMRFVIFAIPAFQVIVFGYAVNTDVRNISMAVIDRDSSRESREFIDRFGRSGHFRIKQYLGREAEIADTMNRGAVRVVLAVPRGFESNVGSGRTAKVQLIIDGTDANTAGIIVGYAGAVVAGMNRLILAERMSRHGSPLLPGVEMHTRAWFNENLESRYFYLPAVIAMLILVITMLLSSMAVVREKELGTMEQIIVTPILRSEFILGKTVPFALVGFIDVAVVTLVARLVFDVPIRGSLGLLLTATGLFLLSTLGAGLFISTVSGTQQQAMMTAFFVTFPAMLLSGFAFPIENMPEPVQWVTYLNPLRHFMVILRSIFLKGSGLDVLWPQFGYLALLGISILAAAVHRFRKRLL